MKTKDAYSYPEYCDIAYNWDRTPECDFIEECIRRYSDVKAESILDIACGTGIHLREFARRGYEVLGLDYSKEMVEFAAKRAACEGLKVDCVRSNMKKFALKRKFECAICMLDSFRYLLTDEDILSHLRSAAEALEEGALYIIDLWTPSEREIIRWENVFWREEDNGITVEANYLQHPETFDPVSKTVEDELIFKVNGPRFNSVINSRAKTRVLFLSEFKNLIGGVTHFAYAGSFYNFDFGLKEEYNMKSAADEMNQGGHSLVSENNQTTIFSIRTIVVLKNGRRTACEKASQRL